MACFRCIILNTRHKCDNNDDDDDENDDDDDDNDDDDDDDNNNNNNKHSATRGRCCSESNDLTDGSTCRICTTVRKYIW